MFIATILFIQQSKIYLVHFSTCEPHRTNLERVCAIFTLQDIFMYGSQALITCIFKLEAIQSFNKFIHGYKYL